MAVTGRPEASSLASRFPENRGGALQRLYGEYCASNGSATPTRYGRGWLEGKTFWPSSVRPPDEEKKKAVIGRPS